MFESPIDSQKTAEEILKENGQSVISVKPEVTIHEAVSIMVEKRVGAIVIMDGETPKGIWTERDLLRNILIQGFDVKNTRIKEHMVTKLHFFPHTATSEKMIDKCLGLQFRHLLIEKHGQFIGLLSIRDILRNYLRERADTMEKEENRKRWEYYEEWNFKPQ